MKRKRIFAFLILAAAFCSTKAQNNIDLNNLPPVIDLITQVSNPSADTIILCSNGGPARNLDTKLFFITILFLHSPLFMSGNISNVTAT